MVASIEKKIRLNLCVVSHLQFDLVQSLLRDIEKLQFPSNVYVKVVLISNMPEDIIGLENYSIDIKLIRNLNPKGFGGNQNLGFSVIDSDFFAVLNPDIRINTDFSFSDLIRSFDENTGCVAPIVKNKFGDIVDNVRADPTFVDLLMRSMARVAGKTPAARKSEEFWFAGMFMVFKSDVFKVVSGFDERFFMYMEDADICRRIRQAGYRLKLVSCQSVVHEEQRQSLKSLQHFKWHLRSAFIYWMIHW